ncbi:MAG: hypothetical protein QM784_19295 [Polyangiaceae bacterium]
MHLLRLMGIFSALLFIGCSSESGLKAPDVVPGQGQLGDACTRSEDCESTVCVELSDGTGVCTVSCSDSPAVCPAVENWECVRSSSYPIDICACLKLGTREECGDGLDNDCNGVADDCRVCDDVTVPNDDPNNCGGCGNVCNRGQSCTRGKCECPEKLPDDCGGCTSKKTDGLNCGACGNICGPGQQCVDGTCKCPEGQTYCEGAGCVTLTVSQDHCGSCGNACSLGRVCKDEKCVCSAEGTSFCDGVGCIDLNTDKAHCGACDKACSADHVCKAGACVCPEGNTECGGACVDVKTSTTNCGECSKACGEVQACVDGTCGCTELGRTICGDECADTKTDAKHCGSCDKACATGETCKAGACTCPSGLYCNGACIASNDAANCGACGTTCATSAGQVCSGGTCTCAGTSLWACGNQCLNLLQDEANCGSCGHACEPGQTCMSGVCSCSWSAETYCPDQDMCIYLSSDSKNCGTCGNACKTGTYCSAGKCACNVSGQTFCNDTDGCVNLQTSALHCGTCGNACHAGETCYYGTCRCPTGQTYCEGAKACVGLSSSAANCGACGNACPSTQTCQSGVCRCPYSGQQFCTESNACVDIYYDSKNCGACGKVCPTGTVCSGAACICSGSSEKLCGDTCRNLSTDTANCGACGKTCASNQVCTNGTCQCPSPSVGTAVRLTTNTLQDSRPAAAWDGTHVGVAYTQAINTSYSQLRFALVNPDGTLVSDVALTTYTGTSQGVTSQPELIWNGKEYALTWIAYESGYQLMFLRLDETGSPKGTPINVGNAAALGLSPNSHNLAWSETYGGYAVIAGESYSLAFRRIGADASKLETPNLTSMPETSASGRERCVQAAPDGSWGVASGDSWGLRFIVFNADGSRTLSPVSLSTSVYTSSSWPALVHDGKTWLTAWVGSSGRDIAVNRGSMSSVLGNLVTVVSGNYVGDVQLAMAGSPLAVGWTERVGPYSTLHRYRVQRFTVPTTTFTVPPALHPAVDVLATENIQSTGDVSLVSTGSGLVAVWADNRWGSREIYAAALDTKSCP